jgi:hypothetical protein
MGAGLAGQRLTLKLTSFATANQSQNDEWTISKRLPGYQRDELKSTIPRSRSMILPELCQTNARKSRGRRECRAPGEHPQPHVQSRKANELVTTGLPNIPAFPAQWF